MSAHTGERKDDIIGVGAVEGTLTCRLHLLVEMLYGADGSLQVGRIVGLKANERPIHSDAGDTHPRLTLLLKHVQPGILAMSVTIWCSDAVRALCEVCLLPTLPRTGVYIIWAKRVVYGPQSELRYAHISLGEEEGWSARKFRAVTSAKCISSTSVELCSQNAS
jgi:hypothetical protein